MIGCLPPTGKPPSHQKNRFAALHMDQSGRTHLALECPAGVTSKRGGTFAICQRPNIGGSLVCVESASTVQNATGSKVNNSNEYNRHEICRRSTNVVWIPHMCGVGGRCAAGRTAPECRSAGCR